MRAELEKKINESMPSIVDHILECRGANVDKDEAIRQATEMVQETMWERLSASEREEVFCELAAVLMLKIAVDFADDDSKEEKGDCEFEFPNDMPPEVVALIKKMMQSADTAGVVALKITPTHKK